MESETEEVILKDDENGDLEIKTHQSELLEDSEQLTTGQFHENTNDSSNVTEAIDQNVTKVDDIDNLVSNNFEDTDEINTQERDGNSLGDEDEKSEQIEGESNKKFENTEGKDEERVGSSEENDTEGTVIEEKSKGTEEVTIERERTDVLEDGNSDYIEEGKPQEPNEIENEDDTKPEEISRKEEKYDIIDNNELESAKEEKSEETKDEQADQIEEEEAAPTEDLIKDSMEKQTLNERLQEEIDEGSIQIISEENNKANQIDVEKEEISEETIIKEDFKDSNKEAMEDKGEGLKITGASNFFTVHISLDDGSVRNQLITIIKPKSKKTFLGGYRHKVSGIEYHHAAVQTIPKPRPPPKVALFSRDTQTFQLKHQKINTDNTTSTQMTAPGIYVPNSTDKLMGLKHYETATEYRERILENVVIIQKYYRRWLAKQVVEEKRKQHMDRLNWELNYKERKQKEKEERIQNEYKRRMHPKTKADFDLLYSDLEKWREEQLTEIMNSDLSEAEKKAKRALLLEEETNLLAAIDRHKIDRKEETKTVSVQKMLSKAAAPKTWKDFKGRKIEMDTQFTIRSRELLEIFNSLNMQYLTPDERLDVLLTLKHTVKEHDCKLTKDIVELIDREADLIMRNLKDSSLAGLRKRISTLFLQYCKTPTFNPQISLLLKVPPESSVLVGDINYCKYCGRYLRSTEFSLSTKSAKLTICKSCARKDNQSRNRQDYSHYQRILKEIQVNEQDYDDGSKIAFIFKQNDVKSLIESVWDGKSIISSCDDLDELVFLRWDFRNHWTPWNTIFLTKDEAEAHMKVTDLTDTYSTVLINRIVQKHVIARSMFGSLEKMVDDFQSQTLKVKIKA